MTAPAGAIVRLYVDTRIPVDVGWCVQTQTGRRYDVLECRLQVRGKHAGTRRHLVVRVMAEDEPDLPQICPIRWYRR